MDTSAAGSGGLAEGLQQQRQRSVELALEVGPRVAARDQERRPVVRPKVRNRPHARHDQVRPRMWKEREAVVLSMQRSTDRY